MTNADIFAARLARIEAGAPNTKGTIFVGQDEQHHFGNKPMIKQGKTGAKASNSLSPLTLAAAFGLGLFAAALGSYARVQLAGEPPLPTAADLDMAISGGIGITLSLVLAKLLRLTTLGHKALLGAGVLVMIAGFHNLAHWAPGQMSALLSPDWVHRVQTEAPPNSARIPGGGYVALEDFAGEGSGAATAQTSPCVAAAATVKLIQMDNGAPQPAKASGCAGG